MARLSPVLAVALAIAILAGAPPATGATTLPVPHIFSGLVVDPTPLPTPAEGRIPVSLRLTESIWTDDDSQPPASRSLSRSRNRYW
jgi:hypothetical protein